jgi:hypothetical protein
MPGRLLKVIACLVTGLAAAGSAAYVAGHHKNAAAPLHPAAMSAPGSGQLHLRPEVRSSKGQTPLTFTSVS